MTGATGPSGPSLSIVPDVISYNSTYFTLPTGATGLHYFLGCDGVGGVAVGAVLRNLPDNWGVGETGGSTTVRNSSVSTWGVALHGPALAASASVGMSVICLQAPGLSL